MNSRRDCLLTGVPLALLGLVPRRGAAAGAADQNAMGEGAKGWPGRLDGIWHWRLPDTPNGLRPSQSWHATGSGPDGSIYVGGMDHATNSALYCVKASDGILRLVGDARSASEAAANWRPGETAQKFHTRPLWHQGRIYVATLDRSTPDDGYLSRRGFHWYAYDPASNVFSDLSAAEPGGTGAPHGGLVTLAASPDGGLIYGASVPTAEIFRYDIAKGRTDNLGRPHAFDSPYVYANRVMWLDARGRLYFTAGNPSESGPQNPSIYGHVHYYDPTSGKFGERRDWKLQEPRALEAGQWLPGRKVGIFSDDQGHIYRFTNEPPSWRYLGKAALPAGQLSVWSFQVSADGRTAYLITSVKRSTLYEFDLTSGRTRQLSVMADLDPAFAGLEIHTGYDAWDEAGRFYFTSFSSDPTQNVLLTRIDPVRLKAALGIPPVPSR